jgi:toxin ParE1/3/4
MKVRVHPDAEADVAEAAAYYARVGSPKLAARFVAEFKRVALLVAGQPGMGAPRSQGRR